jgi:transposase
MSINGLAQQVIVGVDTHKDAHVAVAIDVNGRRLGERMVPTTEWGCTELHRWALGFAPRACYGVEGTGSYGAGLSRYLQAQGMRG